MYIKTSGFNFYSFYYISLHFTISPPTAATVAGLNSHSIAMQFFFCCLTRANHSTAHRSRHFILLSLSHAQLSAVHFRFVLDSDDGDDDDYYHYCMQLHSVLHFMHIFLSVSLPLCVDILFSCVFFTFD